MLPHLCSHRRRANLAAAALLPMSLVCAPRAAGQQTGSVPETGRLLWLDAEAGVTAGLSELVAQWDDRRGTGGSLVEWYGGWMPERRTASVGGRTALHFDGDDQLYAFAGMPTGSYTKVAVITLDDYDSNNNVLSGLSEHALFYGYGDRAQLFHSGTFVVSQVPTPLHEPTVLVASYDAATGLGTLHQNGQVVGTGLAAPHSDPTLEVGAFAAGNFLHGSVAEAMVYDRVLDPSELRALHLHLLAKYRGVAAPDWTLELAPFHGQVVARGPGNGAPLDVAGTVHDRSFERVVLEVERDGAPWWSGTQSLAHASAPGSFDFSPWIEAGFHEYSLALFLERGTTRTLVATREHVVCGDLLLVNGQSNAVAADYWSEGLGNQSQSPWIRSFGTDALGTEVTLDLHWDLAEALMGNAHGSVGAWALRAAELLLPEAGVPIGLINGAVGGTTIAQHQRDDADPENLATIYGRFLYRARIAQIAPTARAMLWYQGESDGEDAAGYRRSFHSLRQDWAEDFPALEKIYVFQVRKGCGFTFAGVRETQRRLGDRYPRVVLVSTNAAPLHDGCHFQYAGYRDLGDQVARLVARDLYGSLDTQDIDPPNVASAAWFDSAHDRVVVTLRDPDDTLTFDPGSEADFLLDDGTAVISGSVQGNTLVLDLAGPSTANTIGYDAHAFDGPFVTNARGVGLLAFFDLPIQ